ncbi:MAG TPA: DUF2849 domain-containing protein [Methylocella sp.]|nr:DUF2849 domain-containing protein [Methylocella sp.]
MLRVISANRLPDGAVVYLGRGGGWVTRLAEAKVFSANADTGEALLLAQEEAKRNLIVEPALVEVTEDEGRLRPLTLRETIRAEGPTINYLPQRRNVRGRQALPCGRRWLEGAEKALPIEDRSGELEHARLEAPGAAAVAHEAAS